MNFKLINSLVLFAVAVAVIFFFYPSSKQAMKYKIVLTNNDIELRDYHKSNLIQSYSTHQKDNKLNFKKLFNFINGDNSEQIKIPMTTPVLKQKNGNLEIMSFVLPGNITERKASKIINSNIQLNDFPSGKYLVIKFKGKPSDKLIQKKLNFLRDYAQKNNIRVANDYYLAIFNPPWTPSFLRKNEIIIAVI